MSITSMAAPPPPPTIAPAPGTGLSMIAKGALTGASYGSNAGFLGAGAGAVAGAVTNMFKFKKLKEKMRERDVENKLLHAKTNSMLRSEGSSALAQEAAGTGYFKNVYTARDGGTIPKHFLGNVIGAVGKLVGSSLLDKGKEKLAGMAGDAISGLAGKATEAVNNVIGTAGTPINTPGTNTSTTANTTVSPQIDIDELVKKVVAAIQGVQIGAVATPAPVTAQKGGRLMTNSVLPEEVLKNVIKLSHDTNQFRTLKPKIVDDGEAKEYRDGGSMNVIPKGVLHDDDNKLGDKGIPVVIKESGGTFKKVAEIEKDEIIFSIAVTKELEKYAKKLAEGKITDKELIRIGKLVQDEVKNNTVDIAGNML